jgi:hypothetical protein
MLLAVAAPGLVAIGTGAGLSGGAPANGASVGKAGDKIVGHRIQGSVVLKVPEFGPSGLGYGKESGVV